MDILSTSDVPACWGVYTQLWLPAKERVCHLRFQTIPLSSCTPLSCQQEKSVSDDPKDDVPLTPANFLMIEDGPILIPSRFFSN